MSTRRTSSLENPNELYMMLPNVVRPLSNVSHNMQDILRFIASYPLGTDDKKAFSVLKYS